MKQFLKLINLVMPSTYPGKLEKKLKRNFTIGQLKRIDFFLSNWKKIIHEEAKEEHIKG